MDFLTLAKERYSCKKYSGEMISEEQLHAILEAGRLAPTAKNLQGQRIYVVTTKEGLDKIDVCTPCRYGAPVVLIVAYDKNHEFTYPGGKSHSGPEDAAIVTTHMMLSAKSVGVDSCWVNFFDPAKVSETFALPQNEDVILLLDLGYAAEDAGPLPNHEKSKELSEFVTYV